MHLADTFIQSDLHCIQVTVSTFVYQLLLIKSNRSHGNRTHDLGDVSAMLYQLSYRKAVPRSREEGCQQNLTEALSQGRHGFTVRETLPWKNTHMGLPEGESGYTDT